MGSKNSKIKNKLYIIKNYLPLVESHATRRYAKRCHAKRCLRRRRGQTMQNSINKDRYTVNESLRKKCYFLLFDIFLDVIF